MTPPSTAPETTILCSIEDGVATLTLNRPARRNALSLELIQQLDQELVELGSNADVRCVVIAAAGPVFSSGHDLKEMTGRSEAEYRELFATCSNMMQRLRTIPQPVIAKVQGSAVAAGCQLVAACDMAVAVDTAQFATPGVKIGLFCTTPMVPLVRAVAPKVAMEMLMTGLPISAARALEAGLVNRVVPADQLDATVKEMTAAICASSRAVIAVGKKAFHDQLALDERTAYSKAVDVMTSNALHGDAQEGMQAFLDKRSPVWGHE